MTRNEVLLAVANGKEVEWMCHPNCWVKPENIPLAPIHWNDSHWRLKTAKVPLGPKDIPSPCWVKCKDYPHPDGCGYAVVAVTEDYLGVVENVGSNGEIVPSALFQLGWYSYDAARKNLLYSPDRLTWKEMSK